MNNREVMQQALEALKALLPPQSDTNHDGYDARDVRKWRNTLDALRAALAEPMQHADPTDPGHDVDVLREHVRHLERRVRELAPSQRKPLTEQVQEPVAWMDIDSDGQRLAVRQWSDGNREEVPLYTAPPQRKPLRAEPHVWVCPEAPDTHRYDKPGHCEDCGKTLIQMAGPEQEPVASVTECEACFTPDVCQLRGTCDHYAAERLRVAAPPQREPLTDEQIDKITVQQWGQGVMVPAACRAWAREIEREHGIGEKMTEPMLRIWD